MTGRIEQENKLREKINEKLSNLPSIFTEFYQYMESDNKSYGTCLHYISYVSDFMDFITQGNIDDEFYKNVTILDIRNYITSLRRRVKKGKEVRNSDSIQATRWSAINTFYNFLVMDNYMETNPMNKTKRPKNKKQNEIVFLEKDEISTILDKVRKTAKGRMVNRDLAIVILGVSTGIRVGAMVQIDVDDIDFKNNTIRVLEKGNKDRLIKFGDNTRAILSQWIMDRNSYFDDLETNALFISQVRQRITTEGIRKVLRRYTKDLDKHITPHCLRKTAATQACKSGVDINTVANILGHNSITTTQRYMAVIESEKNKAVAALDNLF
jgi:site-specific recombinase XerD